VGLPAAVAQVTRAVLDSSSGTLPGRTCAIATPWAKSSSCVHTGRAMLERHLQLRWRCRLSASSQQKLTSTLPPLSSERSVRPR
jgi:hypothetical protein